MDTVRSSFVSKMKSTSQSYEIYSSEPCIEGINLVSACQNVLLMSIFTEPGWGLPIRSNFRYSYKQKKFLYDLFIAGEVSGKKKSPEQVHLEMRKEFLPSEYVTVQQIKSLFSRMSAQQRKGVLKEPAITSNSINEEELEMDDDLKIMNNDNIRKTATSIMTEITVECNKWVIVQYNGSLFPGIVKKVLDGKVRVNCMEYEKEDENSFRWPSAVDENNYEYDMIISSIDTPEITGVPAKNKRKDIYSITEDEWDHACKFVDN